VFTGYVRRWHVLGRPVATGLLAVLLTAIGLMLPAAPAQAEPQAPAGPCVRISANPVVRWQCPTEPLHFLPPLCRYCPVFFDFRPARVLPSEVDREVSGLIAVAIDAAIDGLRSGDADLVQIQVTALMGAAQLLDGTPLPAEGVGYLSPDGEFKLSSDRTLEAAAEQVAIGVGDVQEALAYPAAAERLQASGLAALANAAKLIASGTPILA
jgi:hypothetical protein